MRRILALLKLCSISILLLAILVCIYKFVAMKSNNNNRTPTKFITSSTMKKRSNYNAELISAKSFNTDQYRISFWLQTPFKVLNKGKIAVVLPKKGGGMPIEAFQKLAIIYPNKTILLVNGLKDLKGKVEIKDENAALAFCRLKTSPVSYYLLEPGTEVEVIDEDHIDMAYFYGNVECLKCYKSTASSGYMGIVRKGTMSNKANMHQAVVKRADDSFMVSRTLLVRKHITYSSNDYVLMDVVETIGPDGSYHRIIDHQYKLRGNLSGLCIPIKV